MDMSLGDRMKDYESLASTRLMRKLPVVIRLDGKGFSKYTKTLNRPFDGDFAAAMISTTERLCNEIQGSVIGYTQSDEISIILQDWKQYNTDCWYGYNTQKIVSVAASICTATFNSVFKHPSSKELAFFDARAFNLPSVDEVINYLIFRSNDCARNSVTMLSSAYYSHKELMNKSGAQKQDMLMAKGINWNNLQPHYKRGSCVVKVDGTFTPNLDTPLFTQNRDYIASQFIF